MIIILFRALSTGAKTYLLLCLHLQDLASGCLKFCFSLKICSSFWPLTISVQDGRTESSTISCLAHCNAYWSTASHKSDKFLSQSTLDGSLYFGPFAIRSLNLKFGMIER